MLRFSVPRLFAYLSLFGLISLSSGCDRLGVPNPERDAAVREADANATGAACRLSGKGIEDCYAQNTEASRAAVYAGWLKMNDYMRENKLEEIKPTEIPVPASTAEESAASASASASASAKASGH
jgi:hypothetical protein